MMNSTKRWPRVVMCVAAAAALAALLTAVVIIVSMKDFGSKRRSPHVIFVLVDDLGFNDVSWNNPDVKSPHLERLAREGVILDQNYVQPVCSPSRGALMTGSYPFHIGMQHGVILPSSPECATQEKKFLPEKLKEYGYNTHMLGKWHLGFCSWDCTPTFRGFDTFYGFYQGYIDHYSHNISGGYDWRDNERAVPENRGRYSTDLITERGVEIIEEADPEEPMFMYVAYAAVHYPFQAPDKFVDLYSDSHRLSHHRKRYLAMLTAIDDSVHQLTDALTRKGMMDDTIIIFSSDNGAEDGGGSNLPLRGAKTSVYEGGTRVPGFVYSKQMTRQGHVTSGMMHISDWYPTIVSLAGGTTQDLDVDGVDQTALIMTGGESSREEIIYNLDTYFPQYFGTAAIRRGDYKLVVGFPGLFDGWEQVHGVRLTHELDIITDGAFTESNSHNHTRTKRGSYNYDFPTIHRYINFVERNVQLFNIRVDPEERIDLAERYPAVVHELLTRLDEAKEGAHAVHLESQLETPAGNPNNFAGIWTPGWC